MIHPLAPNRTTADRMNRLRAALEAAGLPVESITLSPDDGTPACPVVSRVKRPEPITLPFETGTDDAA